MNKILLAGVFILSGCLAQSHFNSSIRIENGEQSGVIAEQIRPIIEEFALKHEGTCTHRAHGISCGFPKRKEQSSSSRVFSGIGRDGNVFIAISTTRGHWLWAFEKGIEDGRYISDFHKELERWAVDAFTQFQPQTRTRSYSGYGKVGSF